MNKFTLMKNLRHDPFWSKYIPEYYFFDEIIKTENQEQLFNGTKYILRSSLVNEGSKTMLLSGKSISIKSITSSNELFKAIQEIQAQNEINEVILQEQIEFDTHYTVYLSKIVNYVEDTFSKVKNVLIFNEKYSSGNIQLSAELIDTLRLLRSRFEEKPLLLEVGIKNNQIYFFQINFLPKGRMEKIIQSNILNQLIATQSKSQKQQPIYKLLYEELGAFLFRVKMSFFNKKKRDLNFKNCFLNWQYIFHYYRLYLMLNKIHCADKNSWIEFLNDEHKKLPFIKTHLHFANLISHTLGLDTHKQTIENHHTQILLGQGKGQYSISEDCYFCEKLTPELVYNSTKSLVLTKDNHILSHGFLAASETKTVVIGNLSDAEWDEYKKSKYLEIDFEERSVQII